MVVMLITALLMSKKTVNASLSTFENISLKAGLSLYSGWLCSAFILQVSISLKKTGVSDGWDEATWTIIMLWVASVIFIGNSLLNRDAIFSAVFIWTCTAIHALNNTGNDSVQMNLIVIIVLTSIHTLILGIY